MFQASGGHFWTIAPVVLDALRPARAPESTAWRRVLHDSRLGDITITGRLRERDSSTVVVLVHGLGGSTETHYMRAAAAAVERQGFSCLRLNLRGADGTGGDFYHAGLTADLEAALASPELAKYQDIYVVGFSLGGHVTLRHALAPTDPRVRGVAAVCPPLDLAKAAPHLDAPGLWIYRRHMLRGMKKQYAGVAALHKSVPLSVADANAIYSLIEWDDRIVAPWHGFANAADYYAKMSAGPRLRDARVPTLVMLAEHEPMILATHARPLLADIGSPVHVRWLPRGGHVGFPSDLDAGLGMPGDLVEQALGWLRTR